MIVNPTPLGGYGANYERPCRRFEAVEEYRRPRTWHERMLEEDAYCIDVIRQIQAVQAALNKVSTQILKDISIHA